MECGVEGRGGEGEGQRWRGGGGGVEGERQKGRGEGGAVEGERQKGRGGGWKKHIHGPTAVAFLVSMVIQAASLGEPVRWIRTLATPSSSTASKVVTLKQNVVTVWWVGACGMGR